MCWLVCVLHSIYAIGLAPSHPIRRKGLKVTAVSFDLHGRTVDSFTVTGKKKGGAVSIRKQTVLCEIKVIAASTDENEDGECETFAFTPMIGGKVLEINKRLLNEPELITSDIEGWIALCVREHYQAGNGRGDQKKRRKVDTDNETDGLLDLEQYKQYLKEYDFDVSPLL